MKYSAPRGTKDVLPEEAVLWQKLEAAVRKVFALYNYQEIRTPIFESTELFTRSIGKTTDIVKKEMYTFEDRKGRSLTLRPEETAPVVRACLENNLISSDQITKLYYLGPMFRYERPQAGRQRQFHQAGVEVFGSADPMVDVEVIQLNLELLKEIGLTELALNLNSVGCPACRPDFIKLLKKYFKPLVGKMCTDCQERFESNTLRILDCKEEKCQKLIEAAPTAGETLCQNCRTHFDQVIRILGDLGIRYKTNKRLVRGLDYYTKTAFEIVSEKLGAQNAVSGGGRYDNLVQELGGKPTPAVGFAVGLERTVELLKFQTSNIKLQNNIQLFIATMGDEAKKVGFEILSWARAKGISADMDYLGRSLKAQMKAADRTGARQVCIIGDDELAKKAAVLKDLSTGEQKTVPFDQVLNNL